MNPELIEELERLRKKNDRLQQANEALEKEKRELQQRVDELLRRVYGRRSEKLDPNQLLFFEELFREAEEEVQQEVAVPPEPEEWETTRRRKRRRNGRKELPDNLPRERIEIKPAPEERVCSCCQKEMTPIGEEVTEELDLIPEQLFIRELVRIKYACRDCEEGVVTPPLPPRPIDKGRPGVALLAHVAVSKYGDHLPLYRQEQIFARAGVEISRKTLCEWLGVIADLLWPIVMVIKRHILASGNIQSDDTRVQYRDAAVKGKTRRGFLWIYTIPWAEVVYDFTTNRSRDGPNKFLEGYEGILQADGYEGYNDIFRRGKVVRMGCWAHVRRKFYEARSESPEEARAVLVAIQKLYRIESEAKDPQLDPVQRAVLRQEKARPIVESLGKLIESRRARVRPRSMLGKAIGYAIGQWDSLERYLEIGEAEIDNNSAEHGIRSLVLGRKNWLFFGNAEGGGLRATVFYSLVNSCKRLGVEPFAYLKDVIDRVSTHPASRIWELTPRGWKEAREAQQRQGELEDTPTVSP